MKMCEKCKISLTLESFGKYARSPDGHYRWCKPCKREYDRNYFASHPERGKAVYADTVRYRRENRQYVIDYLLSHPCVDCCESDPRVLQFDHRDPENKFQAVATMMSFSRSKIAEEIAKCDVRCANCHARRTAVQFGWYANLEVPANLEGQS